MAVEVLCVVLTLAVEVIRRLCQDSGARRSRPFAVTQCVLDPYLHNDGVIRHDVPLGDSEAPLTGAHLNTVIANTQPHGEAKSLPEPFGCDAWVGVAITSRAQELCNDLQRLRWALARGDSTGIHRVNHRASSKRT